MKVRERNGMLVITLPVLDPPRLSKSGKRLLVATSRGFRRTGLKIDGKPVSVNAIATTHLDEPQDKKEPEKSKSGTSHTRSKRTPEPR